MAETGTERPPRRSPFGTPPPGDVRARGAIVQVDGAGAEQAAAVCEDGSIEMLAIGPDRWLAVSDRPPEAVRRAVAAAGEAAACTDLTHARVVLRVAGPDARDRLSRGCPMDLDSVEEGGAVATMLGPFEVVIRRDRGADVFEVYVSRSVARSAREWLQGSAPAEPPTP